MHFHNKMQYILAHFINVYNFSKDVCILSWKKYLSLN